MLGFLLLVSCIFVGFFLSSISFFVLLGRAASSEHTIAIKVVFMVFCFVLLRTGGLYLVNLDESEC